MTSVIVALVSALGGAMAGLIPVLFVSQRRRLLRLIEEESKTLALLDDGFAKGQMSKSLRATTQAYAFIATRRPHHKARRQLIVVGIPCLVVMVLALVVRIRVDQYADTSHGREVVSWIALAVLSVAFLISFFVFTWALLVTLDANRESRELAAAWLREQRLLESRKKSDTIIKELDRTLAEFDSKHRAPMAPSDLTAAEVNALLRTLQESVESAKTTRQQEDVEADVRAKREANARVKREAARSKDTNSVANRARELAGEEYARRRAVEMAKIEEKKAASRRAAQESLRRQAEDLRKKRNDVQHPGS